MQAKRILIADDNDDLRASVGAFLKLKGYECETACDGRMAIAQARSGAFSLIVLDVGFPDIDGFEVCRTLREDGISVPVLMLTARDEVEDRVIGLESGADDYLIKPFSLRELAARIGAILRRSGGEVTETLSVGPLTLHLDRCTAERDGKEIRLTPTSFAILKALMSASPAVVSRASLEQAVWGDCPPDSDALRTAMWALRNAVDKPFREHLIRTSPGFGWSLSPDKEQQHD